MRLHRNRECEFSRHHTIRGVKFEKKTIPCRFSCTRITVSVCFLASSYYEDNNTRNRAPVAHRCFKLKEKAVLPSKCPLNANFILACVFSSPLYVNTRLDGKKGCWAGAVCTRKLVVICGTNPVSPRPLHPSTKKDNQKLYSYRSASNISFFTIYIFQIISILSTLLHFEYTTERRNSRLLFLPSRSTK